MDVEWLRRLCLALPCTTEQIQWEDALVFKVGGRMYAVARLEPAGAWLSFKCDREDFAELIERPGIVPAPYLARAGWVALESAPDSAPDSTGAPTRAEIEGFVRRSYELVFAALPRKTQASLQAGKPAPSRRPRRRPGPKRGSPRR